MRVERPLLTDREQDVIGCICQGMTNQQIAAALIISERTVQTHLTNLYRKLDLPHRTALALWAVQRGMVEIHNCPD